MVYSLPGAWVTTRVTEFPARGGRPLGVVRGRRYVAPKSRQCLARRLASRRSSQERNLIQIERTSSRAAPNTEILRPRAAHSVLPTPHASVSRSARVGVLDWISQHHPASSQQAVHRARRQTLARTHKHRTSHTLAPEIHPLSPGVSPRDGVRSLPFAGHEAPRDDSGARAVGPHQLVALTRSRPSTRPTAPVAADSRRPSIPARRPASAVLSTATSRISATTGATG